MTTIYPNNLKNRILDEEKALGFERSETGQYCNMDLFPIVKSQELSLRLKSDSSGCLGIPPNNWGVMINASCVPRVSLENPDDWAALLDIRDEPDIKKVEDVCRTILDAHKGNAAALYNLAGRLSTGEGVVQNSAQAVRLYHLAAEKNHPAAMLALARMYEKGQDVPKDLSKSALLYQKATEAGEHWGLYRLGRMCHMERDKDKALFWFYKAAEQLSTDASLALSEIYGNGIYGTKDQREAARLMQLADDSAC